MRLIGLFVEKVRAGDPEAAAGKPVAGDRITGATNVNQG